MLYIAYGSNLHLGQMARRCPTAEIVGTGELKGYDLRFRGGNGGGLATVEPLEGPEQAGSTVPVLVWDIKDRDLEALDIYEGYPSLYRKEQQIVELEDGPAEAMVYIMNERCGGYGTPGDYYYNVIREGYESAGFDVGYLDSAVERSHQLMLEEPRLELGLGQ